jgi:polyhydroxyalkanoate synthase
LSNSGHVQALINPPGNPKATYFTNDEHVLDPEIWLKGADRHQGSWWEDWAVWSKKRSGVLRARPKALGSEAFPPLAEAPGEYVRE